MCTRKSVNINLRLDFPPEVDLRGIESKEFNITDLSDYSECLFDYSRVVMRNGYYPLKFENFRWVFFLDTYEMYDRSESSDLVINSIFSQKWYKNKYMTIIVLDNNFKFHRRIIPATKSDYNEEKELFDKIYKIFETNQNFIGKYIKRAKSDN